MVHILYLIDSLCMGGAEVLLVNTVNHLAQNNPEIKISLITTVSENGILRDSLNSKICYSHISCTGVAFISGSRKIKKYVDATAVTHIHSHLFLSMMAGRMATGNNIDLIESFHNLEYKPTSLYYSRRKILQDKLTYRKKSTSIYVSEEVKQSILQYRNNVHTQKVVNNFGGKEFSYNYKFSPEPYLRLIAIGNLKDVKNFMFLLEILVDTKDHPITLDIYGEGNLRSDFENFILQNKINVRLMGLQKMSIGILKNYDAFIMSSLNEGMPVSLLEALSFGMPCILPDHIMVMQDVAQDAARFFSIKTKTSLKDLLIELLKNKEQLINMSKIARERSLLYSIDAHIKQLLSIYGLE